MMLLSDFFRGMRPAEIAQAMEQYAQAEQAEREEFARLDIQAHLTADQLRRISEHYRDPSLRQHVESRVVERKLLGDGK